MEVRDFACCRTLHPPKNRKVLPYGVTRAKGGKGPPLCFQGSSKVGRAWFSLTRVEVAFLFSTFLSYF